MRILQIVHGGQTGVDRGAHHSAVEAGIKVRGFMPKDGNDEFGPIPADVAKHLIHCLRSGYMMRTLDNLRISHAVLVIVEDKQNPYATPGTKLTLAESRTLGLRTLVVDAADSASYVQGWIRETRAKDDVDPLRLMVAGPRASKWTQGFMVTLRMLRGIDQ